MYSMPSYAIGIKYHESAKIIDYIIFLVHVGEAVRACVRACVCIK